MPETAVASSNDNKRIIAAKPRVSAGILTAPLGTPVPKTALEKLNDAFVGAGFVTEDGVTRTEDRSTTAKKDWSGLPQFTINEGVEAKAKFAFMEYMNENAAALIYGPDNVTVTPATATAGREIAVELGSEDPPRIMWVFEMMSGPARGRLILFDAQVTSTEDVTYAGSDTTNRGVEVTLYPNDEGKFYREFWNDGRPDVSG